MIIEIVLGLFVTVFYILIGCVMVEALSWDINRMKQDKYKPLARLATLLLWPLVLCAVVLNGFFQYLSQDLFREWIKK